MRQHLRKAIVQVITDETLQEIVGERFGDMLRQNLLDSAANIGGAIQQSSIQIEKIYRKLKQEPGVPLPKDQATGVRCRFRGESPAAYHRRRCP